MSTCVVMRLSLVWLLCNAACATTAGEKTTAEQPDFVFITPGPHNVVVAANGVRYKLEQRRTYAQVAESVDLWVARAEPEKDYGEAQFVGLVPSCYGRALWITDANTGREQGACFLRRYLFDDDALVLQLRLGDDWTTSMRVPFAEIFSDDDDDGWNAASERLFGTDPHKRDSDSDGIDDPQDANPLVADINELQQPQLRAAKLVGQVLAVSTACAAGKPLIVVGEERVRQAFTGLKCTILWRAPTQQTALLRNNPTTQTAQLNQEQRQLLIDTVAREGGIARVAVELDERDAERPVVTIYHVLGVEHVTFSRGSDRFDIVDRRFEVAPTVPSARSLSR